MVYIEGFENDIFISYCHRDNISPENESGWVDHFHDQLEISLNRRSGGKKITLWRDKRLKGNTLFDDRIREKVLNSVLFLVLLSPNYLNSEYCRKELNLFYCQTRTTPYPISINGDLRILTILLRNIHHEKWPTQLKGTTGFPMNDQMEGSDELGDFLDHRDLEYSKKMKDIICAIEKTLNSIRSNTTGEVNEEPGEDIRSVFIANTTDSLQLTRDLLIHDLNDKKFRILPPIPPPWDDLEHETTVEKAVGGACLSVHLLDRWPGRKINDLTDITYPLAQLEIGMRSSTQQFVWVPRNLRYEDIEDHEYAHFLQSLENGPRKKDEFVFIRDEKTCLSQQVLDVISKVRREGEVVEGAPILLDTHPKDQHFAFKLAVYLSGKGCKVDFNQESTDPVVGLRNFEAALKYASDLIIIYGTVAPTWVIERLKKTIKFVNTQFINTDKISLQNIWVCSLPSSRKINEFSGLPKMFRINYLDHQHSDNPDEGVFVPLLARAKNGGSI